MLLVAASDLAPPGARRTTIVQVLIYRLIYHYFLVEFITLSNLMFIVIIFCLYRWRSNLRM